MSLLLVTALAVPPAGALDEDPARQYQWGLDQIKAASAWPLSEGDGMVIAVVDTGVDLDHEDLEDHIVPGLNVFDPGRKPEDDNGRGTHVAGVAAALMGNAKGVAGVAPEAKIMPVKALGFDGLGEPENVATGVRWAADHGADVIEVTLGDTIPGFVGAGLRDAIRYAWAKGAIPVVSAGPRVRYSPGFADEPALVVAATTRGATDPGYESEVGGARWGIAAPGGAGTDNDEEDVLSTYWPHTVNANGQARQFGRYTYLSGTAMAAAHVAGAAAILRSLGLEPQQVVDRLLVTAKDIGPAGRDTVFGAGLLDLQAATAGMRPRTRPTTTTTAEPDDEPTTTSTTERRPTSTTAAPTTTSTAPAASGPVPTTATTLAGQPTASPADADGDGGGLPLVPLLGGVLLAAGGGLSWLRRGRSRGVSG